MKKRSGFYVKKDINYSRRTDLEKDNFHVLIIDVHLDKDYRFINIYRSFRPQDLSAPLTFFKTQLSIIKSALTNNCIVLGDFNLDACMENRLK